MSNLRFRSFCLSLGVFAVLALSACTPSDNQTEPEVSEQLSKQENSSEPPVEVIPPAEPEENYQDQPVPNSKEEEEPVETGGIDLVDVESNNSRESCWIVLRGNVYDFTEVVQQHPFGQQLSNALCGIDATEIFETNAEIEDAMNQLEQFYLGQLDPSTNN